MLVVPGVSISFPRARDPATRAGSRACPCWTSRSSPASGSASKSTGSRCRAGIRRTGRASHRQSARRRGRRSRPAVSTCRPGHKTDSVAEASSAPRISGRFQHAIRSHLRARDSMGKSIERSDADVVDEIPAMKSATTGAIFSAQRRGRFRGFVAFPGRKRNTCDPLRWSQAGDLLLPASSASPRVRVQR